MPKQLVLIPDQPLKLVNKQLALDELPADAALVGPNPSRELVTKVGQFGVLVPILVRQDGHGRLHVIEGRRRIKAARKNGLKMVPARITTMTARAAVAATIMAHATRNENVAAELQAITDLMNAGSSENDVSEATGLRIQTIRKRLLLSRLLPGLLELFMAGKVSVSVAEQIAKLPHDRQKKLVEVYDKAGEITAANVREVRQAVRDEAAMALPFEEIERPAPASKQPKMRTPGEDNEVTKLMREADLAVHRLTELGVDYLQLRRGD
jgi:ParB/RepB/Spo0J family partition protein